MADEFFKFFSLMQGQQANQMNMMMGMQNMSLRASQQELTSRSLDLKQQEMLLANTKRASEDFHVAMAAAEKLPELQRARGMNQQIAAYNEATGSNVAVFDVMDAQESMALARAAMDRDDPGTAAEILGTLEDVTQEKFPSFRAELQRKNFIEQMGPASYAPTSPELGEDETATGKAYGPIVMKNAYKEFIAGRITDPDGNYPDGVTPSTYGSYPTTKENFDFLNDAWGKQKEAIDLVEGQIAFLDPATQTRYFNGVAKRRINESLKARGLDPIQQYDSAEEFTVDQMNIVRETDAAIRAGTATPEQYQQNEDGRYHLKLPTRQQLEEGQVKIDLLRQKVHETAAKIDKYKADAIQTKALTELIPDKQALMKADTQVKLEKLNLAKTAEARKMAESEFSRYVRGEYLQLNWEKFGEAQEMNQQSLETARSELEKLELQKEALRAKNAVLPEQLRTEIDDVKSRITLREKAQVLQAATLALRQDTNKLNWEKFTQAQTEWQKQAELVDAKIGKLVKAGKDANAEISFLDQKRRSEIEGRANIIAHQKEFFDRKINVNDPDAVTDFIAEKGIGVTPAEFKKAMGVKDPLTVNLNTGLQKSNVAKMQQALVENKITLSTINTLRDLSRPEMFGAAGWLRQTVFGLAQQGNAFGRHLWRTSQDLAAHAKKTGADKSIIDDLVDRDQSVMEALNHSLAYMSAKSNDPNDRVSNEAYRIELEALGAKGMLAYEADYLARLDAIEMRVNTSTDIYQKILSKGTAIEEDEKANQPLPDLSGADDAQIESILKGIFK